MKGPFEVVDVKRENDYLIDVNGSKRMFHINLLKQYFDREQPESQLAGCFDSVECQDIVGCLLITVDQRLIQFVRLALFICPQLFKKSL